MISSLDLSTILAFAPRYTPLTVLQIGAAVRGFCASHGVREGDRVVRRGVDAEEVIVTKPDGRTLLLTLDQAVLVAVGPALVS